MFNLLKNKDPAQKFTPTLPLTWWIDDLTHSVCGLVEDPVRGLAKMPWPDCDKVYLAVNKEAYDQLKEALEKIKNEVGTSSLAWKIANDALNATTDLKAANNEIK